MEKNKINNKSGSKVNSILKQKINVFLISYFNHLTLAAAVLLVVISSWLFVYPRYRQISQDNELARQNLETAYEEKAALLKTILNLKEAYQSVSASDREKIYKLVPDASDENGLLEQIELIAAKNSVALNSLKIMLEEAKRQAKTAREPGGPAETAEKKDPPAGIFTEPPQGVKRLKLEINLSSVSYPILKNVLKTIENNLRLLDVANVDYSVKENKATLMVYAYYLDHNR